MQNKKIAMGLLLASFSCSAVDQSMIHEKNLIHEAIINKSYSLSKKLVEYIKNNATQNPELVRSKCLELAKILNIELDYFIENNMRHNAVQRENFISLQDVIINNIYKYDENRMSALINYASYLIKDHIYSVNFGIDNDDIDQHRLCLQKKGVKSFINKINKFEKSLDC